MPEYSDYIEGLTAAGTLDGTEILGGSKSGNARRFTVLEAALFASGTGTSVDTTGGTITLNFDGKPSNIFFGSASFATPKTIALANDTNAKRFEFQFNITNIAAVLTFPSTFKMADVRWDSSGKTWTPFDTGVFKGSAFFDGTNWLLEISQAPYV